MPPMYPVAIAMAFELAAYGLIIGLVYGLLQKRGVGALYISLLTAMVGGRLVWGLAEILLLGLAGNAFTMQAFLSGALLTAVPGIVLQLVLIPCVMVALIVPASSASSGQKGNLVPTINFHNKPRRKRGVFCRGSACYSAAEYAIL